MTSTKEMGGKTYPVRSTIFSDIRNDMSTIIYLYNVPPPVIVGLDSPQ